MTREAVIERRIRAALEKVRTRGDEVRAIYLSPDDRQSLDALASRRWGSKVHRFSFDDHPIISASVVEQITFDGHPLRDGNRSIVYDRHGCGTAIAKSLSHRTKPPRGRRRPKIKREGDMGFTEEQAPSP